MEKHLAGFSLSSVRQRPEIRAAVIRYSLLALALALLIISSQSWADSSDPLKPVSSRKAMPALALPQIGGGTWRLVDHHGSVVLINFWATWCAPCRQETPGLVDLFNNYKPKGLSVIGVAMDEGSPDAIISFARQFRVPYPIARPETGSVLFEAVDSLPTSILLDRDGRIAKVYVGAVREAAFRADIEQMISEKK